MKSINLTVLFALISFLAIGQRSFPTKKLEKKIDELLAVSQSPGLAIAVVRKDKVLFEKGFGYRNLEKKLPVDQHTLFAIGSTSKAFTTALLGILSEEHDLSFDDNPRKFIPELSFYNDALNNELTLKDLISHRSGLPRHDFSWYLFPTQDKDSLIGRVKHHEPITGIRTSWYYNNFGFLIQGVIAEKLTRKSWEENIEERFFKPLEMQQSNLNIAALSAAENSAKGYDLIDWERSETLPYFNIAAIGPAGSINSSASEMGHWLQAWLNKGKFKDQQVIPEGYINTAKNPLMLVGKGIADPKFPDQHLNSYGYAWFISSYKGHYRMEHGGNIDGFTANACLFPEDDLGIIVLANQNGSAAPALARNIIADLALNLPESDWIGYLEEKISAVKKQQETKVANNTASIVSNTSPSHITFEFTGDYFHPGYGAFSITANNDSLFANFKAYTFYLKHRHYDIFEPIQVKNNRVDTNANWDTFFNFQTGISGAISGVSIKFEPTLDPIIFERTPHVAKVQEGLISRYIGSYELGGMTVKISQKQEFLLLDVPGQPQYTLLAENDVDFAVKGLEGYKIKFVESETKSWDLQMIQPNGTFVAKKVGQ